MSAIFKIELWMKYRKHLFSMLFLVIVILGGFYMYFLNIAVLKTGERAENLNKLSQFKREFQGLEIKYIGTLNKLDFSYARSLGFVEAAPDKFIHRQKPVAQNNNYGEVLR